MMEVEMPKDVDERMQLIDYFDGKYDLGLSVDRGDRKKIAKRTLDFTQADFVKLKVAIRDDQRAKLEDAKYFVMCDASKNMWQPCESKAKGAVEANLLEIKMVRGGTFKGVDIPTERILELCGTIKKTVSELALYKIERFTDDPYNE